MIITVSPVNTSVSSIDLNWFLTHYDLSRFLPLCISFASLSNSQISCSYQSTATTVITELFAPGFAVDMIDPNLGGVLRLLQAGTADYFNFCSLFCAKLYLLTSTDPHATWTACNWKLWFACRQKYADNFQQTFLLKAHKVFQRKVPHFLQYQVGMALY